MYMCVCMYVRTYIHIHTYTYMYVVGTEWHPNMAPIHREDNGWVSFRASWDTNKYHAGYATERFIQ